MPDAPGDQLSRTPGSTPTKGDWSRWRVPMTLLVVLTFAFSWTDVPRGATSADLARDLAAGVVTTVDVSPPSGRRVGPTASIDVGQTFARQVRWRTEDGRLYQAPVTWLESRGNVDLVATVLATADSAGHPLPTIGTLSGGGWSLLADAGPALLYFLLVLLLVLGPQPRRMTKWGVFWLLLAAGGLGAVWWLWRDAPWSPSANRLPQPSDGPRADGQPRRLRGWVTLPIALAVNVAISALLVLAFSHLYSHAGGGGPVEWSVVNHDGVESTWVEQP